MFVRALPFQPPLMSCPCHQGLLENFSKNPGLATPFYKAYYLQLLREVSTGFR